MPTNEVYESCVFTPVCHIVHIACLGTHPPGSRQPPWEQTEPSSRADTPSLGADTPIPGSRHPIPGSRHCLPRSRHPPEQTLSRSRHPQNRHPQSRHPHIACWEIWATNRQYASYWNVYPPTVFFLTF